MKVKFGYYDTYSSVDLINTARQSKKQLNEIYTYM
jgi:hypothetical protein